MTANAVEVRMPTVIQRRPEVVNELLTALKSGVYLSTACEYAGVNYNTVNTWIRKGRQLVTRYEIETWDTTPAEDTLMELALEIDKAQAGVEIAGIATIKKAQNTDWRAAAWLLEHRFPSRWSERKEIHHKVDVDVSVKRENVTAALEELQAKLAEIEGGSEVIEAEVVED